MEISARTNPIELFSRWLHEAATHPGIREATAMALATVALDGGVQNRIVLCKSWSEEGFVFYTNYLSRKGRELDRNPHCSAVFYWDQLGRQIRITGRVEKVPAEQSRAYWKSRPRESQISQYVSQQSEVVGSREELEKLASEAEKNFAGQEIPCPDHWGGYLIKPKSIEFWIAQPGRLHDRFEFEKSDHTWTFRRLYP